MNALLYLENAKAILVQILAKFIWASRFTALYVNYLPKRERGASKETVLGR